MKNTHPPTPPATPRVPPQDIEAEKSLLGGLLLAGGSSVHLADALALLTGDMFYREVHGAIFEAMRHLYAQSEPVDAVTVRDRVKGEAGAEGQDITLYLLTLSEFVPSSSASSHYAAIVLEKWRLRQVIEKASVAASKAWAEEASEEVIAGVQQDLLNLASVGRRGKWRGVNELLTTYTDALEDRYHGGGVGTAIPTGFVDIDRVFGGFKKSELAIVAARPSMGKTSLAMQMAINQASKGYGVAVFSLEMSSEALTNRMVSSLSSIPSTSLDSGRLNDAQWNQVQAAAGRLWDLPLSIEDETDLNISQIESKVRELSIKGGLDLVYIDYLTLIRMDDKGGSNRSQVVGDVAKSLKNMARRYDIGVQCLSQLSRSLESRDDKRPRMSDLRDSGNIEEHADKALFIYRPAYYSRKEEAREECATESEEVEIIFGKNRNGPTGMVRLDFTPAYTRFSNATGGVF